MSDTAQARLKRAVEALKPFAALACWVSDKTPDDMVVYRAVTATITAGDLRRAARAIEQGK